MFSLGTFFVFVIIIGQANHTNEDSILPGDITSADLQESDISQLDAFDSNGLDVGIQQEPDLIALQVLLLSAKGALGFWRQLGSASSDSLKSTLISSTSQLQGNKWNHITHRSGSDFIRRSQQLNGGFKNFTNNFKCPSTKSNTRSQTNNNNDPIRPTGYAGNTVSSTDLIIDHNNKPFLSPRSLSIQSSQSSSSLPISQILAVEGTNVQLNFALAGYKFAPITSNTVASNNSSSSQSKMRNKQPFMPLDSKIRIDWLKSDSSQAPIGSMYNLQPMSVHSAHSRGSTGSTATHTSPRNVEGRLFVRPSASASAPQSPSSTRLNQLIINEPQPQPQPQQQQQQQLLLQPETDLNGEPRPRTGINQTMSGPQQNGPENEDEWRQYQSFMLAPYINEPLLSRLSTAISQLVSSNFVEAKQVKLSSLKRGEPLNVVDRHVGSSVDQNSIDWNGLSLHLSEAQFGFEPSVGSESLDCAQDITPTSGTIEDQLSILRLELNQLTPSDSGYYQLRVCLASSSHLCHSVGFILSVAPDIPRLENWFESQILDPGDRLSIKCQATGFTLPQISWFLDNQLLSEQQQHHHHFVHKQPNHHGEDGNNAFPRVSVSSHFRIGDYVSQDNHVHSFVNSSHIEASEGGAYKCQANNGFHLVEHVARIDVRGPAVIERQISNQSVLVGTNELHVQCPYSGYPIAMVEWYFKPFGSNFGDQSDSTKHQNSLDNEAFYSIQNPSLSLGRISRARREPAQHSVTKETTKESKNIRPKSVVEYPIVPKGNGSSSSMSVVKLSASLQSDQDPDSDLDKDEWLDQASSMTTPAHGNGDDYTPDSWPDYPPADLIPVRSWSSENPSSSLLLDSSQGLEYDYNGGQEVFSDLDEAEMVDSSSNNDDYESSIPSSSSKEFVFGASSRRGKRDLQTDWTQFPQSRRHQIHSNGTLVIQSVTRADQGYYKCRVLGGQVSLPSSSSSSDHLISSGSSNPSVTHPMIVTSFAGEDKTQPSVSVSNEFLLTVLVPPVISPFSSADTLREGMRNFLTCSVIEGDSPVHITWFKDNQPIEDYIAFHSEPQLADQSNGGGNGDILNTEIRSKQNNRIRVDTSNEFTSTLYFSHVEYKDNGNYTCMATNKAASVNYTARMLVNVPPKWIKAPKDVESVAGQNVIIDCQAQAYPNPRIWWEIGVFTSPSSSSSSQLIPELTSLSSSGQVGPKQMTSSNQLRSPSTTTAGSLSQWWHQFPPNNYRTIISNSRTHILENASLVIRDVNRLDQGYYLCQAANNFGSLSSLIKLSVNVGASFVQKYLIKHIRLNENVELDCDPIGQSPVDVVWFWRQSQTSNFAYHHQHHHNHQENRLNSNGHQQQLITNSTAKSHHSPIPINKANQSLVNGNFQHNQMQTSPSVDSSLQLDRRLFAGSIRTDLIQPSGSISKVWPTESSSERQQTFFDLGGSITFEVLKRNPSLQGEFVRMVIKQAKRIHSADFVCQASNRYGTDEKLVRLLVQESPDPVSEISILKSDSRSVSLAWLAPFNGNSPITSYTLEWRPLIQQQSMHASSQTTDTSISTDKISSSTKINGQSKWFHLTTQQTSATINSLEPMTSYEIRISAQNQLGSSHQSNQMTSAGLTLVTTSEEAPNAPPSDLRAVPLSSSSIQVSWLPPIQTTKSDESGKSIKSTPYYTVKGYYLGYKVANSSDPLLFKTVSLMGDTESNGRSATIDSLLALPESYIIGHGADLKINNLNITNKSTQLDPQRFKVIVKDLKRGTKYSIIVQAFSSAGSGPQSDILEVKTLLSDPPPAPQLRVAQVTNSSIEILWSFDRWGNPTVSADEQTFLHKPLRTMRPLALTMSAEDNPNEIKSENAPTVDGYKLYFRTNEGQWEERHLTASTHKLIAQIGQQRNDWSLVEIGNKPEIPGIGLQLNASNEWYGQSQLKFSSIRYTLDRLFCGSFYQIYMVAYNSIGTGQPSQIVKTKTKGAQPIAPRRVRDFMDINSTYAIMHLDSWLAHGCSITNFEIRYKHLVDGRPMSVQASDLNWLPISNNINPEMRSIELRDLQPENWYAIMITADSSAGKTETLYKFMTLDRFGNISPEAMIDASESDSPFPALFQSPNASLRAILYNLSVSKPITYSFLLTGTILFIMVIGCLFLTLKNRSNGSITGKDNPWGESQITSGAMSTSHYTLETCSLMDQRPYESAQTHQKLNLDQTNQSSYPLKTSPFKTSNPVSNQISKLHSNSTIKKSSMDHDRIDVADEDNLDRSNEARYGNEPQSGIMNHLSHCPIHLSNQINSRNETGPASDYLFAQSKFSTLNREPADFEHSRFRTLPHGRPVSTFSPNGNINVNQVQYGPVCRDQQQYQEQQQILSKLRFIYGTNGLPNGNVNDDYGMFQQQQQHEHQSKLLNNLDNNLTVFDEQNAINLAILAQQQADHKSNQMKRDIIRNSMQSNHNHSDQLVDTILSPGNHVSQQTASEQIASILMDCHQNQNQQQQQILSHILLNGDNHHNKQQQHQHQHQLNKLNSSAYGIVDQSLNASTVTSSTDSNQSNETTTNQQHATPSSSSAMSNVTSSMNGSSLSDQLISINDQIKQANGQTTMKGYQTVHNANSANSNQNAQAYGQTLGPNNQGNLQGGPNNEQSDYALPFPPKWV